MVEPIPLNAAKRRQRARANNDLPESDDLPCPVTSLGHIDGKFWFLNVEGERRGLSARQLGSRAEIAALFLGDMSWLQAKFKNADEDGPRGWKIAKATEWLMAACRLAGMYGEHVVIRRQGVWQGSEFPIAHCGDAVFADGKKRPPGEKINGQIFAAAPRMAYPAAPADRDVARTIQGRIRDFWRLQVDGGDIIAIGLVGQGFYAAALSWRANGFISGGTNAGKSMLLDLLRAMSPMHHYTNDTSKAGVEGAVNGRAVPVFVDEAFDTMGAETLINIVLAASSGTGTKGHRGTADGGVRDIEIITSVVMACINPPEMQAQHRSRFTMIELERPESGIDHRPQMEAAIAEATQVAPALFGRALAGFGRFKAALKILRAALGGAGCVAREMDQLGAILAGYWMLTEDVDPSEDDAGELVKIISSYIVGADEMRRDSAPRAVAAMLLSRVVNLDRSTDQESIAKLLRNALDGDAIEQERARAAARVLARWGIRPVSARDVNDVQGRPIPRLGDGDGLWIDERCAPLQGIFANSPFQGKRWIMELRRLPSARKSDKAVRVSDMGPCKAIWISADDILEIDDSG